MSLLHRRTPGERALFFALILVFCYLIRLPMMPFLSALQEQNGNWVSFLLRFLFFTGQLFSLFCPIFSFATALSLKSSGLKHAFGILTIYFIAEFSFQLLFTAITYWDAESDVLMRQILSTALQWLIFSSFLFLFFLGTVFFSPRKAEKQSKPHVLFSIHDRNCAYLLALSLLFFAEKITVRLIRLSESRENLLWLESSDINTAILDIVCYFIAVFLSFLISRFLVRSDEKRIA